jgi:hypothetical protein
MYQNLVPSRISCASLTTIKKDEGFLWIFHGEIPVKNPLAGQTSDFHVLLRQNLDG